MHYLILFFILFVGYCSPVYGQAVKDNKGTFLEGSSGVSIEKLEKSDSIDPFGLNYPFQRARRLAAKRVITAGAKALREHRSNEKKFTE